MNKWITLFMTAFLLCINRHSNGQTYDFPDNKIPGNWYGQKDHFEVSSTGMLHLNAPAASASSFISWNTPTYADYLWEFYVHYDFAASPTNYTAFYVLSQLHDPGSPMNKGYYIKVGGATGSMDKVELYYQNGPSSIKILESRAGIAGGSIVSLQIRLYKSAEGKWTLYTDSTAQHTFIKEASGMHISHELFPYSAIRCIYSSGRRTKFYIGNIQIIQPFSVQHYSFPDARTLLITFQ